MSFLSHCKDQEGPSEASNAYPDELMPREKSMASGAILEPSILLEIAESLKV